MNHTSEQVFQLFMEKLSGDISPEDEAVLEEMLSKNPSFREIWHSMEEEAAQLNIHEFLERVSAGTELDSLKGQINARAGQTDPPSGNPAPKIFSLKRALSAAAVFLIMIGG